MENKKFEKLIDLIINEDEEQAKDLFHDIVVEKSREIYESIMEDEQADDLEEGMGGQVGDLADEISAEHSGIAEDEEEINLDSEEVFDIEGDEEMDMSAELDIDSGEPVEVEDAVIRIEDKLDQLMAEFEEIMGTEDDLEGRDDEIDADLQDIEGAEGEVNIDIDDEELVAEAITLNKVATPSGGDNGDQSKSPVDANSGQKGIDSKPVNFDKGDEKGRPAPKAKDVDGASSWQNQPGKNAKAQSAAPKPVTAQASGTNTKSVID